MTFKVLSSNKIDIRLIFVCFLILYHKYSKDSEKYQLQIENDYSEIDAIECIS